MYDHFGGGERVWVWWWCCCFCFCLSLNGREASKGLGCEGVCSVIWWLTGGELVPFGAWLKGERRFLSARNVCGRGRAPPSSGTDG